MNKLQNHDIKLSNQKKIFVFMLICISLLLGRPGQAQSQLAAPTISLNSVSRSGIVSSNSVTVTMSAAAGATIYFTTDGMDPGTTSLVYSSSVVISDVGNTTIKAYAVKAGNLDSTVVNAYITVDPGVVSIVQGSSAPVQWFKSDHGVELNSGAVATWIDFSASPKSATQSTAANRPLLVNDSVSSLPALKFDSSSQHYLSIPSLTFGSWGISMFAVVRPLAQTEVNSRILNYSTSSATTDNLALGLPSDHNFHAILYASNTRQELEANWGSLRPDEYQVLEASMPTTIGRLYNDGLMQVSQSSQQAIWNVSRSNNYIGRGFSPTAHFQGNVAEIIVFSGTGSAVLTDSQRAHVAAYLVQKHHTSQQTFPTPQFYPASGTTFTKPGQVAIVVPEGAEVFTTQDGSEPTDASDKYNAPLDVSYSQTINILVRYNGTERQFSASYTLDPVMWPAPSRLLSNGALENQSST